MIFFIRKHRLTKHLNMEYTGGTEENDEEGDDEFSMEESAGDTDPSPFRCHICSVGFELRAMALSHMRAVHPEECASIEASVTLKMEAGEVLNSGLTNGCNSIPNGVECIFCPNISRSFLELRKHVSKDHGVKYTCDICQKSFSLKKLLVRHKKKHDSGVSSGEESEEKLIMPSIAKKKPSLMDTINKLSKQKEDSLFKK